MSEENDNLDENINLWTDILKEDQQWDFTFLEKIILHKVKLMRDFYLNGESHIAQESVDRTVEEMTVVINALERLLEGDYIHFPEGKQPTHEFIPLEDDTKVSRMVFSYHPEFDSDAVEAVYLKARQEELKDRALVYDTLRDKSPSWWD